LPYGNSCSTSPRSGRLAGTRRRPAAPLADDAQATLPSCATGGTGTSSVVRGASKRINPWCCCACGCGGYAAHVAKRRPLHRQAGTEVAAAVLHHCSRQLSSSRVRARARAWPSGSGTARTGRTWRPWPPGSGPTCSRPPRRRRHRIQEVSISFTVVFAGCLLLDAIPLWRACVRGANEGHGARPCPEVVAQSWGRMRQRCRSRGPGLGYPLTQTAIPYLAPYLFWAGPTGFYTRF